MAKFKMLSKWAIRTTSQLLMSKLWNFHQSKFPNQSKEARTQLELDSTKKSKASSEWVDRLSENLLYFQFHSKINYLRGFKHN